jgi:predicted ATPase/class 3 adenylate cyclase
VNQRDNGSVSALSSGTVTFLFTDVESSTALWDGEPAAMSEAIRAHDTLLRAAIDRQHGHVFSTAGDGFGAVFRHAGQALGAALDAQQALAAEVWPTTSPLRVRMGIHTGPAEERDGDYLGPAVNRAARIMGLASGNQILASLSSQQAFGASDVALVDGGEYRLKGFGEPERIFAVSAPGLDDEPPSGLSRRLRPPRPLTRLIGRDSEVEAIADAARASPLVTLTGVGGVGKTRLALAVAERLSRSFSEGEFWIELALIGENDDVTATIAAAFGIVPRVDITLVQQIAEAVSDRRILIALDNCEHVAPAVRAVVTTLLERCPRVGVLATSRERLGVAGERIVAVAALAADDRDSPAVTLLADRIDGGGDGQPVDSAVLVEIAQRVDGLPLALELAAARCRALGPAAVVARLHQLSLLADRSRPDQRHQTLEAVLTWSYDLLEKAERRVLDRVSVFAGMFTLDAAEQVAAVDDLDAAAVDDAVASLVEKSLVERHGGRFRLLETTRQFSARQLQRSGVHLLVRQAHTDFVVNRARVIHAGLHGPDEVEWVAALDAEWPDVRAVVRRALDDDDAETVITLVTLYAIEALWRRPEAFAWTSEAVTRYGDRPGPHRHELLGAAGIVAFTQLDVPRSIELGEAALAADPHTGTTLDFLPEGAAAGAYFFAGRIEDAVVVAERRLAASTGPPDVWSAAQLACSIAIAMYMTGSESAADAAVRAERLATLTANPTLLAYASATRAATLMAVQPDEAMARLDDARRLAERVRNRWLLDALILNHLAHARVAAGLLDDALTAYLDDADRTHATGWTIHAWQPLWSAVTTLFRLGRLDEAVLFLGGCEASRTPPFAYQTLPPELEALTADEGEAHLRALRALGATLSLPELVRIARGDQDVPRP